MKTTQRRIRLGIVLGLGMVAAIGTASHRSVHSYAAAARAELAHAPAATARLEHQAARTLRVIELGSLALLLVFGLGGWRLDRHLARRRDAEREPHPRQRPDCASGLAGAVEISPGAAERSRVEALLAQQAGALQASMDGIAVLDPAGRFVFCNRAYAARHGYAEPDAIRGQPWESVYPADEQGRLAAEAFAAVRAGGRWRGESVGRRSDGSTFPQEISLTQLPSGGTVCVLRDTSERETLQQRIAHGEARFRSLIENAEDLVAIFDANGCITYASPSTGRVLGCHPERTLGRSVLDLVHPHDRDELRGQQNRVLAQPGRTVHFVARHRHAGRGWRVLEGTATNLLHDPAVRGVVANARDVTERCRAEETLRSTNEALERSNRELEQFAYVASHDLQEPLRKIQAFGGLLLDGYAEHLDERGVDYLQRMQGAAGRMQTLIQDLLSLSRITSKGSPFAPVSLQSTAREVVEDLDARLRETGGRVHLGALPDVDADRTQMRQLLQNLIGNALKFHREGVPPEVWVDAEPAGDGAAVRLRVRDNGIGFDAPYAERIFQPFQRLHGRSSGYQGTGMGLAICRRIVERHGGSIRAHGEPGGGATFEVTLNARPQPRLAA